MIAKLAWRNIWRNRKRSLITAASVLVAVFLSLIMRSMQLGTYKHMIDSVVGAYTGYIQIHAKGYWDERSIDNSLEANDSLISKLSDIRGVASVLPRLENYGLLSAGDLTRVVNLNGIELEKERKLQDIDSKIIMGTLFQGPKDIVIGKGIASYFETGINDTLVFVGQGYHGMLAAEKFRVSGITDLKNPNLNKMTVLLSLRDAQNLFSAPGRATSLVIDKEDRARLAPLKKGLQQAVGNDDYEVMDWQQMMPELHETILADSVGGLLMVAILYMILIFGIFGTVLMMTRERLYEFGILVSIGMKKGQLISMVFIETVILSLIGVIAGLLLAYPVMLWKHYDPFVLPGTQAEMVEKFGFSAEIPFYIQPDLPLVHALLIFSIALLVALYPAIIISRLKPIKAMRI